jgi:hypothetical protein
MILHQVPCHNNWAIHPIPSNKFLEFGNPTFKERRILMYEEKNDSINKDELGTEIANEINSDRVIPVNDEQFMQNNTIEIPDKEEYIDEP